MTSDNNPARLDNNSAPDCPGELSPGRPDRPAAPSPVPLIGRQAPWLAPLAGHTALVFRVLCRELGAAVTCTEMVSAKGLIYGERGRKGSNNTVELLRTLYLESPAAAGYDSGGASAGTYARKAGSFAENDDTPTAIVARARTAGQMRGELLLPQSFPASPGADSPLVVQLFGDDPDFLGQSVALLRGWGFEWFDLNLGCSVPKVTRAGAGAALARDLAKTLEAARLMIREAGGIDCGAEEEGGCIAGSARGRGATGVPGAQGSQVTPGGWEGLGEADAGPGAASPVRGRVGFKIRLGWNAEEENYLDLAKGLEQCGAAWITLHPRYARQGFSGSADWAALAELRRAVSIPVMASGDLFDASSALRCLDETGADGAMFARGALHNPAIFADYLALVRQDRMNRVSCGGAPETELSRSYPDAPASSGGRRHERERGNMIGGLHGPGSGDLADPAFYAETAGCAPGCAAEVSEPLSRRAGFLQAVIMRHAELARALTETGRQKRGDRRRERDARPDGALLKMRGAIPRYVKELPGSRAFRVAMSRCSSWNEFYDLVEEFFAAVREQAEGQGDLT